MDYQPSKKLGHADGLLKLIPKNAEPFEDTVIAALKNEMEIKTICATLYESYQLP